MIDSKHGDDVDNRQENVLEFVTKLPHASLHIRDQLVYKKSVDETFMNRRCNTVVYKRAKTVPQRGINAIPDCCASVGW